jgi:hypothetical protein
MHNAPSVSYPVGRSRFAALLLGSLWLGAAATTLLWVTQLDQPGWRAPVAGVALLGAGAVAAWAWLRSAQGELAWDGEAWARTVGCAASPGTLAVALDLQRAMLLHWREAGATHWLWLDSASRADRWSDLRRAVYSRARPEAARPARQPASRP